MSAALKVVLVGFMGAGKSTAGRTLDAHAVDTDKLLERRLGRPIDEVFATEGEAAFRRHEEEVVLEALAGSARTVSLGGGALGSERVRAALAPHRAVWLDVDVDEAWRRVAASSRPLARDEAAFRGLHADREATYAQVADAIVVGPRTSVAGAVAALDSRPVDATLVWARAGGAEAPVWVGSGVLGAEPWPLASRRFLVTDGHVGRLYADRVEPLAGRVAVMPGEQSKTVAHAEIVWTELARAGMTREDHVVALGGGVVGDLAGFCAATYQRGVPVVQVPTTLVAQVDSAYGGKTGVDLPEAKNYVGAYHQPAAVLVDPAALSTLPAAERSAGYAEVVKTALIAGGRLWERVRGGAVDDEVTVLACARTKLRIVSADERDSGRRQVLNLGHTVGHAIETATGYARYRHGEAVALGLLAALRLSGQPALREEAAELLAEHGLPTRLDGVEPAAVVAATQRDKKRLGHGPVPFVLVATPGDVRHGQPVPPGELSAAVEELTR